MGNTITADPTFREDIILSVPGVWKVGEWLGRVQGYDVVINGLKITPTPDQKAEYADTGDLWIRKDGKDWMRVEVKRKSHPFTTEYTAHPLVIVDAAHIWDTAAIKPYAYFLLSPDNEHFMIVFGSTHAQWIKNTVYDRKNKRDRTFYFCSPNICHFRKFNYKRI